MEKLVGQIIGQFKEFYKNLTPIKRMSILAAGLILFVTLGVVSFLVSGNSYTPLFTNVPSDQMANLLDNLQKKNVPFRLSENGTSILVPKELLHSTQMAIMTDMGGNKVGQVGLELFEKQDFGVTSYAQKINYQRALQGELMRSINTLDAVKQSKVILALPPKKTFLEEGSAPSASVVIELHDGKTLLPEQVRGITNLVASSVEGLEPEKVTVVDSRGKLLSRANSPDAAGSSDLFAMKSQMEQNIEDRIESILNRVVGGGKVIARVNIALNPRHTTTTEEKVDPDSTAIRSAQKEEEMLDGARTNPTGVPGARANLPGAEDNGEVGFKQNVRKELSTTNFAVPKTVRNIRESAGGIERISVAVVVDGVIAYEKGTDGKTQETWKARTPEELAKYESLVKNAIGFNETRGDKVKIENIAFQKEDFSESEKILTSLERKKLLHSLFKWSLLGLALALFFFLVIRPFMFWITESFQESVEEMLPRTIEELEELQAGDNTLPGMSGALPVLEESLDPDKAESELLKERIMGLLEHDQEKAAGAFNLWLAKRE